MSASPSPVSSYKLSSTPGAFTEAESGTKSALRPTWILYASAVIALLQPLQYGFSSSQLNLSKFNNEDDCNADPVKEGTCIIFPGHSKLQWVLVVNFWLVGCIIGSFGISSTVQKIGPKRTLMMNAVIMILSSAIQASAGNIWQLVVGRLIAGLATGISSAVVPPYVAEISPPHLRNTLGMGYQISMSFGGFFITTTFFYADTSAGWRYLACLSVIVAIVFLVLSMFYMVESPSWLLLQGRRDSAMKVIGRLYGHENIIHALEWVEPMDKQEEEGGSFSAGTTDTQDVVFTAKTPPSVFGPEMRRQTLVAIGIVLGCQLSGINTIFYYSSDIFSSAGMDDDKVGTVIMNFINFFVPLISRPFYTRFGSRNMLIFGPGAMCVSAVGITISYVVNVPLLSVVFAGLYVAFFEVSMGVIMWAMIPQFFPEAGRPRAMSVCVGLNWASNLIVGLAYPYIATALGDYNFLPFAVILAFTFVFMMKCVPDVEGKTTEEIQQFFRSK